MTQPTTRAVTFSSGSLTLEGLLHVPAETPAAGVVVCHPHPQYGGQMESNVVVAACEALAARGIAALRFNFRGVGRSKGSFDNGRGERDDVRAALDFLRAQPEIDASRIGLCGYSFGAMMAAEVASGELRALALVSPPLAYGDLRVAWGCPAFVIGGDYDPVAPEDRLRVVGEQAGVEVRIVEGADHSWWEFEDELGEALGEFFERHLS
jgi:alpha/beta superfamily hydrolase